MGIYIKGFEKKPCAECMFRGYERCLLTDEYLGVDAEYKPEECPLIEVKAPHGRLIDLDTVVEDYCDGGYYIEIPTEHIDEISVVIEAEVE